jgi:hypothetical protein
MLRVGRVVVWKVYHAEHRVAERYGHDLKSYKVRKDVVMKRIRQYN